MSNEKKKLFLLDAFALIFRAHFAFSNNPRINSKGLNTSVMFGFTNTLLDVLNKQKPTHIAVAFDTPAPTFRHKEFVEYKAHRQETPEDIKIGTPYVREIIKGFNIPILECDGFEADDVIGTIAKKASKEGFEVYMMTPDKDFGQLVEENVFLYKPAYMGNKVDVMGVPEVLEKWDIEHVDQVRDILGLQGDSSDNIPGIPGIGPKTAAKLLKEYGSVEEIVAHADELKGKQKETVIAFGQQGILSKHLATIVTDVPVPFDPKSLEYDGPNQKILKPLFDDLEFRTLARRVFNDQGAVAPAEQEAQLSMFDTPPPAPKRDEKPTGEIQTKNIDNSAVTYHRIETSEARKDLVSFLNRQEVISLLTVTDDPSPINASLSGIALSYLPGEAYFLPVENESHLKEILVDLKEPLENPSIKKTGHNIKYDLLILKKYGIEIKGLLFDSMIAHYLIDAETPHTLQSLSESYLNYYVTDETQKLSDRNKRDSKITQWETSKISDAACESVDIALQLTSKLEKEIEKNNLKSLYYDLEVPLLQVLAEMEFCGVSIDEGALKEMSVVLEKQSNEIQTKVFEIAGVEFNLNSPKQLGEVLFEKLRLIEKPKKTKSGQYATGEEILSKLASEHEIADLILNYREYQKLKSTYVDALPAIVSSFDHKIHTNYSQAVAATGRLSSINPNLQNIPIRTEQGRLIRKAFVPSKKGYQLMSADYSQIELRIMASFSEDQHMVEAFKKGQDIHASTASKIFDVPLEEVDSTMRRKAKSVNFGLIYGQSAFGLAQNLNISRTEAKEIIDAYFNQFPSVKNYMDRVIREARENEYVETILGRRRYLRDINSKNMTMRGFAERNAINAPIQGSAADIIKVAMVNIARWMKGENLKSTMIMQVHDELVFEVESSEKQIMEKHIRELMEKAIELKVPMVVDMGSGENWLEAH